MIIESSSGTAGQTSRRSLLAGAGALAVAGGVAAGAAPASAVTTTAPAAAPSADWDTCLAVARSVLVRDDNDESLVPRYADVLLKSGLPRSRRAPRKVLVIGAAPPA